jgi:hypothetical protein
MRIKRFGAFASLVLGFVLTVGVAQAGAAGSTTVLKFFDPPSVQIAIGFNENSNSPPPVGAQQVVQVVLENIGSQFGKPNGAKVGHVVLDCTVLSVNVASQSLDGTCSGIAHTPDGYITFAGDGIFQSGRTDYWAITGGVGPYANDRGEIKVVDGANGTSVATVTLDS